MMITRVFLTLAVLLATPLVSADDINGFWKHSDEPGRIEIRLDEAKVGFISRSVEWVRVEGVPQQDRVQ